MHRRYTPRSALLHISLALVAIVMSACGGGGERQTDKRFGLQFDPGTVQLELGVASTVTQTVTIRNLTGDELAYSLIPPPEDYGQDGQVLFVDVDVHTVQDSVGGGASHELRIDVSCPVVPGDYQYLLPMEWQSGRTELVISAKCVDAPIETIVAEATRILDLETRNSLTSYDPESGVIEVATRTPLIEQLEPGHVLVSEPAPAIPEGLLRIVLDVIFTSSGATILTDEAGLNDLFEQFEIDEVMEPEFELANLALLHEDAGLSAEVLDAGTPSASLRFNFDHVLFDRDNDPSTTDDRLTVNGSIGVSLKPEIKARMAVQWRMVCIGATAWGRCIGIKTKIPVGLTAYYFSGVTVSQSSDLHAEGSVRYKNDWRIPIAEHVFPPTTFFVGPVPVVITHKISFFLDANLNLSAEVVYEYKQTASLRAGVEFDGRLKLIGDVKRSSSEHFEFDGNLDAGLYTGARWESRLYGVVGPFAQVRAGLRLGVTARASNDTEFVWRLDGCLYGDVGIVGRIRIFLLKIEPSSRSIYSRCNVLRQGSTVMSGELEGRVISSQTGEPIPDATVRVGSREISSGLDGTFHTVLPPGNYHLEVRQSGYTVGTAGPVTIRKGGWEDAGNISLIPLLSPDEQLTIVLEWDRWLPEDALLGYELDLDSYFGGEPGSEVLVYWGYTGSLLEYPYVALLNDALGGEAPEARREELQVTFLATEPQHTFTVQDYWATGDEPICGLLESGARVTVYRGSTVAATFSVPESSGVVCPNTWAVFTIDTPTGEIYPLGVLSRNEDVWGDKY